MTPRSIGIVLINAEINPFHHQKTPLMIQSMYRRSAPDSFSHNIHLHSNQKCQRRLQPTVPIHNTTPPFSKINLLTSLNKQEAIAAQPQGMLITSSTLVTLPLLLRDCINRGLFSRALVWKLISAKRKCSYVLRMQGTDYNARDTYNIQPKVHRRKDPTTENSNCKKPIKEYHLHNKLIIHSADTPNTKVIIK